MTLIVAKLELNRQNKECGNMSGSKLSTLQKNKIDIQGPGAAFQRIEVGQAKSAVGSKGGEARDQ